MIPVAHKENLIVQEFEDELIIADDNTNTAHCLNSIAARVWECCDGYNSIDDIARLVEENLDTALDEDVDMRGLVWLTLEELQRHGLIKEYLKQPIVDLNLSRRKILKRLSLACGFAAGAIFPSVITSCARKPPYSHSSNNSGFVSTPCGPILICPAHKVCQIKGREPYYTYRCI
jgi:hypothetical protein